MPRILESTDSIRASQLGDFCPFWTVVDGSVVVADTAEEMIEALPSERRIIDPVGVIELLQFGHMLGERTLIKGVNRLLWRSTLRGDGKVVRHRPIAHGTKVVGAREVARELLTRLERELVSVVEGRQRIFLLLSGGLDSRIVCGVLKRVESQIDGDIICVTWGQPASRDVVYAQRIADWYGWDFVHVRYTPELVWENIVRGAVWGGAEVNGIHLHGEVWFHAARPSDLVIASSFGDSVGRAEFSGSHLSRVSLAPLRNVSDLIYHSVAEDLLVAAEQDRATAWEGTVNEPSWTFAELDKQENYMRRMICHAMDYVRQFCDLHQAFTSDQVVSYMWSLSLAQRTDDVYRRLLKMLDERLYSLPWARTGVAPSGRRESNRRLSERYHEMNAWLRGQLRPKLEPLYFSDEILNAGLFHRSSLERVWQRGMSEPKNDLLGMMKPVLTIASLTLACKRFELKMPAGSSFWYDGYWPVARRLARYGKHFLRAPGQLIRRQVFPG